MQKFFEHVTKYLCSLFSFDLHYGVHTKVFNMIKELKIHFHIKKSGQNKLEVKEAYVY